METQDDFIAFSESPSSPEETGDEIPSKRSEELLLPMRLPEWVQMNRKYSRNMITRLDQEIIDFANYIKPTTGEITMRNFTLQRLKQIVGLLTKEPTLYCFGSFAYDLYLPHSDLDVVVVGDDFMPPRCLNDLERMLEKHGVGRNIQVIAFSKVPIVKYTDTITNFQVDVSFNMTNGVEAVLIVRKMLDDKVLKEPIRVLMYVLKQFLHQRNLSEVFTGGIGSYSLLCMIISFLKMHPKIQTKRIDPIKNIGILLLEYLELYGKNFNYANVVLQVSTNINRYFPRSDQSDSRGRKSVLYITDPQDPSNNVSAGSYNFLAVKHSFFKAYTTLTAMVGAAYEENFKRIPPIKEGRFQIISLLGNIIQMSRTVLEQREFVQIQYEKYNEGLLQDDAFGISRRDVPEFPQNHKRKREDDEFSISEKLSSDEEPAKRWKSTEAAN